VRRGAIFALIAIAAVVAGATTALAVLVDWLPDQASEEREAIDFVLWLTVWICVFVFSVVAAISIYAAYKFRARPDDDSDGPPIHGHTGIEIAWTVVPTILVTIIAVASAIVLAKNDAAGEDPLVVEGLGQQFTWQFTYPEQDGMVATDLYLPVGRPTKLVLAARDVIHSFWVPEFGQKQDMVPGIVTTVVVTPTKVGRYRLICTELCGLGHALMRSQAIVLSAADFEEWARERQTATRTTGGAGQPGDPEQLFVRNCGGCHVLEKAGTTGTAGPPLDDLDLELEAVAEQIRKGGGGMPAFENQLSDRQIQQLVQYVGGATE